MSTPYKAAFLGGARVRIASRTRLERFREEWNHHHKLQPAQLVFGDSTATVKEVSFYHGGDPLYVLENIPGIWHEELLELELETGS